MFLNTVALEIVSLWNEYDAGESPEAMVVKDIDKLEMILQADEYERTQNIALQEFFDCVRGKLRHPTVDRFPTGGDVNQTTMSMHC